MKLKTIGSIVAVCAITTFSCKDEQAQNKSLEENLEKIESVEKTIDSTLNEVNKKSEEVENLIQELDSI